MAFLGGKNLIFTLVVFILFGVTCYLFHLISFIFEPLHVIATTIFGPTLTALILYYLFNPLVNWLERHHVKRIISVAGIFILVIGLLVIGGFLVYPAIQKQIQELAGNFPSYVQDFTATIQKLFKETILEKPIKELFDSAESWTKDLASKITDYIQTAAKGASAVFSTLSSVALIAMTAPIITFFLLKDDQKFFQFVLDIIPPRYRKDAIEIGSTMNNQVGAYLKGQVIVSIAVGIMTFIGFKLIGLPYAGIMAIIVGVLAIIPYIGPFVAFIPCVIIAIMVSWGMLLKMSIVWMIVQMLNGHLVEPQIMGKHLVVHPLTIVIVLLVMGDLFGMFGLVFGIPVYALFKVLVTYFFRKFKRRYNRFYGEDGLYDQTEFSKDDYLNE